VNIKEVPDDVRYRIFDYLWERGVRSSDLGVDPTYVNRNRKVGISDKLLEKLVNMLTVDEFVVLTYYIILLPYSLNA
jgi:hypothetical protein